MKHAGYIFGILFITALFFLAVIGELFLLDANPPQLSVTTNLTMGEWKESFKTWAFVCVGTAAAASFLWYIFAQKVFNINNRKSVGKRVIWTLLSLFPAAAIAASVILVERTESSLKWVYLLFALNGLLPYYLATLLFSPSSFKYTPIGAKGIRSRCFW